MTTKNCSRCKVELPATTEYFLKQSSTKSGLSSQCKECKHEYYLANRDRIIMKSKKYYEENKEVIIEKSKEYRLKAKEHKKEYDKKYYEENKEKKNIRSMKYAEENKEKLEKYRRVYYKDNKERIYELNRKWKNKNPDRVKMARSRRFNKKKLLPSTLTLEQWDLIKRYFDKKCAYCGCETPLEQEHFIPSSKGGGYTMENIIPSCRSCNASKNDTEFQEWYKKQETYDSEREKKIYSYLNSKQKSIGSGYL